MLAITSMRRVPAMIDRLCGNGIKSAFTLAIEIDSVEKRLRGSGGARVGI